MTPADDLNGHGALVGRVAVITGAGRGIGREHALLFAAEGAKVVVNDVGTAPDGRGTEDGPADEVVSEIRAAGGEAVANHDDVADWEGAERLVRTAVDTFGDLHVLVNNAGILRDRMLVNMTEDEWDAVVKVHLKGHFCPLRWAAAHWRDRAKSGHKVQAAVLNTSSASGLFGKVGQTNYGAAKMGIAAMTIIASKELSRYGVRVNAIAPGAHTRLTAGLADSDWDEGTAAPDGFDAMHPGNVSPWAAYLSTAGCPISGRVFLVVGGQVHLFQPWSVVDRIEKDGRWTLDELKRQGARFADVSFDVGDPFGL
jgi:NAD(P)-dependent dehydrogenase (short-subunit alcohol dehydrogenase family)